MASESLKEQRVPAITALLGYDQREAKPYNRRVLFPCARSSIILDTLVDAGLLQTCVNQRSDSIPVLGNLRCLTRLTLVAKTMRAALNDRADADPDWLTAHLDPTWAERATVRGEAYRLPKDAAPRCVLEMTIGQDGYALLNAIAATDTPDLLRHRPAIHILRQVWVQQYYGPHTVRWCSSDDLPPHALLITSPYETEARFATKHQTSWIGYKAHVTETCAESAPHLSTNGETGRIHARLAARDVLPPEHLLDSGYVAADVLGASHQQQVDVLGPVLGNNSW